MSTPTPGDVHPTPETIALQLYTLRQATAEDMLGTLRRVAEIGYRAVEFAGYGGVAVPDLRTALDDLGLRATAAHVPLAAFEERLPQTLAELRRLGCQYAVLPFVGEEHRGGVDAARRLARTLNRIGAACRDQGLSFAYHNHAFEFDRLPDSRSGATLFDLLAQETDPTHVVFELDLFWAARAGVDPVALLRQHSRRAPLIHVKDLRLDDAHPDAPPAQRWRAAPFLEATAAPYVTDAPAGDGILPWDAILPAAAAAGARWYIVEQDHPRDPLADVARSLRNLRAMSYEL